MTEQSDQKHAETVRQAAEDLNRAMAAAADAGLRLHIDIVSIPRAGHIQAPVVRVDISRAL